MNQRKTVIVTGASSGVGKACTELLVKNGFNVLACVRQFEHGEQLKQINSDLVHPLIVDLEDQKTIESATHQVKSFVGDDLVDGLVNCAGTIYSGPIEFFPRELWFKQYDVNLIGTMALTAAFLPMIKRKTGRIVNIGAVGGGLALPFFGAIASAKIAFQAANDCLRRELYPWGIHVIIIEPGGINTPANQKMRDTVADYLKTGKKEGVKKYGKSMDSFTNWAYEKHINNLQPIQIAETVLKALTIKNPKTRYRRGIDSWGAVLAKWILPDRVLDWIILKVAFLPTKFGKLADESD